MVSNIEYYRMYTLVDITKTGVTRDNGSMDRDQQRNYETVLQAVGLITQPHEVNTPVVTHAHMEWLEFGEYFQGEQIGRAHV